MGKPLSRLVERERQRIQQQQGDPALQASANPLPLPRFSWLSSSDPLDHLCCPACHAYAVPFWPVFWGRTLSRDGVACIRCDTHISQSLQGTVWFVLKALPAVITVAVLLYAATWGMLPQVPDPEVRNIFRYWVIGGWLWSVKLTFDLIRLRAEEVALMANG